MINHKFPLKCISLSLLLEIVCNNKNYLKGKQLNIPCQIQGIFKDVYSVIYINQI